jgi:site-specific DNA recombinase
LRKRRFSDFCFCGSSDCTGYKGKCPEPYVREEVLGEKFTELLKGLSIDEEILTWVTEALRQSHEDEKSYHDEAIARLQTDYNRLQNRIDAMYVDKLDGRIEANFYDQKANEWHGEQDRILRTIEEHQTASRNYLAEGIQILELASHAYELFEKQEPREKRRLLNFMLSNCTWKNGELEVTYRQPFDMLVKMNRDHQIKRVTSLAKSDPSDIWLPINENNSNL